MTIPYQPEPGCTARQRQLEQQLADTRREVRALEGDLGQARERSAELQARVEQLQTGTSMREALLTEARDLLEPWGGHGDDWPSLVPPIEALIGKLDEALQRAEQAEARLAEQDSAITWGTSCLSCARVLDSCYAEHVRAEKAEAERDQFAAGVPLVCCDERHEAKVRGLEQLLTAGQKATEYWEGAYTREVAAHGRTEGALNRVRAQCERWRQMPDRKRAAEEMLAELDRAGDHFADNRNVIKAAADGATQ
jgi:DNA repair exonuclease SbcCD ATPase subunit